MQSFIEKKTDMEEFIWKLKSSHSMAVNKGGVQKIKMEI